MIDTERAGEIAATLAADGYLLAIAEAGDRVREEGARVDTGGHEGHASSEPMSARRASSSAWMALSTTGSSAPFITPSRLYAL